MKKTVAIRREDKNIWERRVPLIPSDLKYLSRNHGISFIIQPSDIRVFSDAEYQKNGGRIGENMESADLVIAVKEIPEHLLSAEKTYMFFSHTIKGQSYNMTMLKKLMQLKCSLIDYERIVDDRNRRLIFFGQYAGYAGMIETLHAYGKKLKKQGIDNPLIDIRQAYEYASVEDAKNHIRGIGEKISQDGLMTPGIFGFTGYGNVSQAAQEIFDLLPGRTITPEQLSSRAQTAAEDHHHVYKVVFKEKDIVTPLSGSFSLQDYYDHPENYRSGFHQYIPNLSVLVNCIYWTEAYPRLITRDYLQKNPDTELSVIGDISVDINGSIEITSKATYPDNPVYTYNLQNDTYQDGISGKGITVMAIDNLPCEFPGESSAAFSHILRDFIPEIIQADFDLPFDSLRLPEPIKKALILQKGQFTDDYKYMSQYINNRKL